MKQSKAVRTGVCMVIPVYRETPTKNDVMSLSRIRQFFPDPLPVFLVCPTHFDERAYVEYDFQILRMDDAFFRSTDSYSRMMLTPAFYEREEFSKFRTMIVCQTDVLLLKAWDEEISSLAECFDYIGALWPEGSEIYSRAFKGLSLVKGFFRPMLCKVGNGGLSARNIEKSIALLKRYRAAAKQWNSSEDAFFAYYGLQNDIGFRIADEVAAAKFALEMNAREEIRAGRIPFGVHAWEKYYPELAAELEDVTSK